MDLRTSDLLQAPWRCKPQMLKDSIRDQSEEIGNIRGGGTGTKQANALSTVPASHTGGGGSTVRVPTVPLPDPAPCL